jgi:thiol-disulfide isomerase/thioredoxin
MNDIDHPVMFAKIDATVETTLAQEHSIEGYPTLKIFHKNSAKSVEYDGPRQPGSAIAAYMKDFADPTWTPPPSDVAILTADNFTTFTTNEQLTLVEFYAPWCTHCQRLESKYEKAATLLRKETNIRLAKVDATVETALAASHNITGYESHYCRKTSDIYRLLFRYPSVFIYRQGGKRNNYEGELTEQGIVSTMKEFLSSPSRELRHVNDYKSLFRRHDQPVIVGIFTNENDQLYQLFIDYAYKRRKHYQFGHTFQSISSLKDIQAPAIILEHHPDVRSKYELERVIFNQVNQQY